MASFLIVIAALIAVPATAQVGSGRPLSDKQETLHAEIAISTLPTAEIDKLSPVRPLDHDTEVDRSEAVTIILRVPGCQAEAFGDCKVSADIVTYGPSGAVHSETKGLSLARGRTTAPLRLQTSDPTGLYRVVATVRDLNAQRFATVERIFGVK